MNSDTRAFLCLTIYPKTPPYGYRANKNRRVRWYITGPCKMIENNKREYMHPTVEILTARVEYGYANSIANIEGSQAVETYTISNTDQGNKFHCN